MTVDVSGRPRLATRLTLAMVALLLAIYVILLAGYAADIRERRAAEVDDAVISAQMAASVVDGFRGNLETTLLAAALALNDHPPPLDQASVGPLLDGLARSFPSLRALFLTDPQGVVIASQANSGVGADVSARPYIMSLQAGAEAVWSGGLAGLQTGQTTIAHARVVRGPDGQPRGFMVAAFQPPAVVERLPIAVAPDARVILIDEHARVLFASESTELANLDDLSGVASVRQALDGTTVRLDGETTPLATGPQYGALVPVGSTGWAVGYIRPVARLETALRDRLIQQALAVTLVMLVAGATIAYLTRRLLRPLGALVAAAAAVARGERTHVGVAEGDSDILVLAGAMDAMGEAVAAREDALRDEARVVETLRRIGETLAAELNIDNVVQAATDAATDVTGAEFGAFFYNLVDDHGESYMLYALSGVERSAFEQFPMPRNTPVFGATFRGEGIVRLHDVTLDPRYGQNPPHHGMPAGHLPVRSYLAAPVVSRSGKVLGGLFFGHSRAGVFTEKAERLARGIAAQAAIALDNAQLYRQAQDAIRLRDQFLSIASHELRTPLAAIKATAQATQRAKSRGQLDDQRLDRSLNNIATATDRVTRLASDLLDVARLRTGQMSLEREHVDVLAVLENVAAPFRQQWEHQRRLAVRGEPGALVVGDAGRLEQVFANLLDNAAKYSASGDSVEASVERDGDGVLISITDRGIGLPQGAEVDLFEPFGRASNAVAQHIQGLGLGLYISRQIVEAHAGRIWAESAGEGEGTTFHVWLPLAP